jgi:hypothetical protein
MDVKKYKVYCLRDKTGEIKYIGQTRQSLSRRFTAHKCDPQKRDKEFTIELIQSFDTPEPMFALEAMLIKQYNLIENGWNKAEGCSEGKLPHDASKELNGFHGHKHSEEVKSKISERSKGNKYAVGSKSRSGQKNSKEHTEALVESRQRKVMCVETGEVFKSGRAAAEKLGLKRSKICLVCQGKRKSTGGLRFIYIN